MKYNKLLTCCILLVSLFSVFTAFGQPPDDKNSGFNIIYLHTDRSYFITGEPAFFKAYILDEGNNSSLPVIDSLFVVLLDQDGIEVSSRIFPVINKQVAGYIKIPDFLNEGNYLLIASIHPINDLMHDQIFTRIVEIRKSVGSDLYTDLTLADTPYESGSPLTAYVRFSGEGDEPVPSTFTYQLTGLSGKILSGKNKANMEGKATLKLQLPQFDEKEKLKLLVDPKNGNNITGIVIPTRLNNKVRKIDSGRDPEIIVLNHLNIQIKTDKLQYEPMENIHLDISVTDDEGTPMVVNLSVSVSDATSHPLQDLNKNWSRVLSDMKGSSSESDNTRSDDETGLESIFSFKIRDFFAKCLLVTTQAPGNQFIVQEKNNIKKLQRKEGSVKKEVEPGYSSDRSIFDILMQIKPYHLLNGNKIVFGMTNPMSFNNMDGALIVVDGINMGTDANILNTIPVQDIARIKASTQIMDIQKYTSMNSVGVVEISLKKTKEFLKIEEAEESIKSNALFWEPNLVTNSSGITSVSFLNNNKSKKVIISVDGIGADGLYGSSSIQYSVK